MHELPITKSILDWACLYAEKAKAQKVVTIVLQLGVLRDLKKEWLQRYFRYISRDTIAAEAVLVYRHVPAELRCRKCGKVFIARETDFRCPDCKESEVDIVAGRELYLESMEVE